MKRERKISNVKWEKVAIMFVIALILIIALIFICGHFRDELPEVVINQQDNQIDNEQMSIVSQPAYKQLSGDSFEIDYESQTINFPEGLNKVSFCVSTNPNGPQEGDEWIVADGKNTYELIEESDETKKAYVYYLADVVSTITAFNTNATMYTIASATELNTFASKVNSGTSFSGKTIILLSNITVSSFTPIGTSTAPFAGTFDGCGYTVSGLNISSTSNYVGLFGYCTGKIENVIVSGTAISGANYVGGVAGYCAGTIENCVNNIPISATGSYAGGIVGNGYGTINYCQNNATVTAATNKAGGIIGNAEGGNLTIYNCRNTAAITTTSGFGAGGIVGTTGTSTFTSGGSGYYVGTTISITANISYCTNTGNIKAGGKAAGGIVGEMMVSAGSISNCKNEGTVNSNNDTGGIAGTIGVVNVSYCINTGAITGVYRGAGIVGLAGTEKHCSIEKCYNRGAVTLTKGCGGGILGIGQGNSSGYVTIDSCGNWAAIKATGDQSAGGIVGNMQSGVVTKCFNLSNVSGYRYTAGIVGSFSIQDSTKFSSTVKNNYTLGYFKSSSSNRTVCGIANWVHGKWSGGSSNHYGGSADDYYDNAAYLWFKSGVCQNTMKDSTTLNSLTHFVADNYSQNNGKKLLAWQIPPTILRNPFNVIRPVGTTETIDTIVYGAESKMTYQWYVANSKTASGTAVAGGTNSSLSVTVQDTDKYYYCIVTGVDSAGSAITATTERALVGKKEYVIDISSLSGSLEKTSYEYTGSAIQPKETIKNGSVTLTKGTDYTVSYQNNTAVGSAKVIITGVGAYSGTLELPFTITKASITGSVKITGTNTFGYTLTADTSGISPTGCTLTYQWYYNSSNSTSGGTAISGATSSTYKIGSGLAGKYIYVQVTASKTNYNTTTFKDITDTTNNGLLTVQKAAITPVVSMSNYTYGGTKATPSVTGNTGGGTVTYYYNTSNSNTGGTAWTSVTSSTSLNAGTYYMYAVVGETTNYKGGTSAAVAFTISKASITGSVKITGTNTFGQTLTANTSGISPTGCTFTYKWWYSTSSTATSGTEISGATGSTYKIGSGLAGKYIGVTVTASKSNYTTNTFADITDATNNGTATVQKASINPKVTMDDYTYGGTKATPTITGNSGNGTVTYYYNTSNSNTGGTAWTNVTSSTSLKAGTYYMYAVVGESTDYKGATTPTDAFTIGKASIFPTVNMSNYTYAGTKSTPSVTGNSGNGTATYYYNTSNSTTGGILWSRVTNSTSLDVGTYYMYAVIGETDNYKGATTPIVSFKILEANITGSITVTGKNTYNETLAANTTGIAPTGCTLKYQWYTNTSNSTSGGTAISGATSSTYKVGSGLAGKYIYVEVTASKKNYITNIFRDITDATNNGTVTVAKASINPVVSMNGYVYASIKTEPSITGNTGNGTVTYYYNTSNSNTGGIAWTNVTSSTYLNAGTYYMYAVVGETTNYKGATTAPVEFVISKAGINPEVIMNGYTYAGTISTPSVTGNTENGTVTYYYNTNNSNTSGIAWTNVTSSTYLNAGTYYIYAVIGETTNYKGATTAAVRFVINKAIATLTKGEENITLVENNSYIFEYNYVGDGELTVSIADPARADVTIDTTNKKVTIKAKNEGHTTVTISSAEGTNYLSQSTSIDLTVIKANYNITKADGTSTNYNILQDAVNAAEDGETITVLNNVVERGDISVDKDITIDLQEKTITTNAPITIEEGSKVTIVGGNDGTIKNTEGTAIINNGTLTLGKNNGTYDENQPTIEGKDYGIVSGNGEFIFNAGTIIGANNPPYTGEPSVLKNYYIDITKEGNKYKAEIKMDNTAPKIYTQELDNILINSGKEIKFQVYISEPESKITPSDFALDDIIFEVKKDDGSVEKVTPEYSNLIYIRETNGLYVYELTFKGIKEDGDLIIRVDSNEVYNKAKLGNVATILVENKIVIDFLAPDLSNAKLEIIKPEDGVTIDGTYELKLENVKDNHEIAEYQWQIKKKDELTWGILETISSTESYTQYAGKFDKEDTYEIRVRVADFVGNYSYTNTVEIIYEEIDIYNSKPTIRFEKELVKDGGRVTEVKIHAIVKSTTNIVSATVNNNVPNGDIKVSEEGKYQIRTDIVHTAYANTVYKFIVKDENGNITTEVYNVGDITRVGFEIKYKIVSATAYESAKIVFSVTGDDAIKLVSKPESGYTADMKYSTSYSKEVTVRINNDINEIDDNFVFVDTIGNEIEVHVIGEVDTADRKLITVKAPPKSIYSVYGDISLGRAQNLVSQMKNATKVSNNKVTPYYGMEFAKIKVEVSSQAHLDAVSTLGRANKIQVVKTDKTIAELKPGNNEIITGVDSDNSYSNGNKTGIKISSDIVLSGTDINSKAKSFHITIINR